VTYQSIRQCCRTFAQHSANQLARRPSQTAYTWHLDQVFLKITGKLHDLWRAVDQQGYVQEILVQSRGNKQAAKKFFGKLLKRCQYLARVVITDKLASYRAAKQELLRRVEQRQHIPQAIYLSFGDMTRIAPTK
jgi:putative transposase